MTNEELYNTYTRSGIEDNYAAFLVLNPDKRLNASLTDYVSWVNSTRDTTGKNVSSIKLNEYLIGEIKQLDQKLFVNLTPDEVRISDIVIPPSGDIPHFVYEDISTKLVGGLLIRRQKINYANLPEPSDKFLIVHESLRKALPDRTDLVSVCGNTLVSN